MAHLFDWLAALSRTLVFRAIAAACLAALLLDGTVLVPSASAQSPDETLAFEGGRWFDGESFRKTRFYSVDGVLRTDRPETVDRRIDLGGTWVVPAFGEAHNHNVADADGFEAVVRRYLREGVFYVKTMSNLPRLTAPIREKVNRPDSVDVLFANGGLTGSGGHPIRLRELLLDRAKSRIFLSEIFLIFDTK